MWRRRIGLSTIVLAGSLAGLWPSAAAEFDITHYGATADDTRAIIAALQSCGEAGGGTIVVPPGAWLVSRQRSESLILEIPSNTTVRGEGDISILKYALGE